MLSRLQPLVLAAVLASALFFPSCSGSSAPAGGPIQSQGSSTTSLQGRYALLSASLVGSLNFDGHGNAGGEIQFFDTFVGLVRVAVSGTYSVGPDSRGTMSLKAGPITSRNPTFGFVLLANGDVLFTETDLQSSDAGIMKRQDPSSFSFAALNATYSFGPLAVSSSFALQPGSSLLCPPGALTIDQTGTITIAPGVQSLGRSLTATSIDPVTGNIDVSQTDFRTYALYVVSSNEVFAQLFSDSLGENGPVGCQIERNRGPLSNTASSSYTLVIPAVPFTLGTTLGSTGATFSVANGAVQSGTIDVAGFLNGVSQQIDQPITSGAFSVNADGSCSVSLGTILSATCFAVSSDFAFLQALARNPTDGDLPTFIPGLMTRRQTSSFALNSLIGSFGVAISGIRRDNALVGSVARVTFDGNGNVSGTQDSNAGPGFLQSNVALQGTYTMAPNGRGTLTLTSSVQTSHYAIYLASASEFYLVGLDADFVTGFGRK